MRSETIWQVWPLQTESKEQDYWAREADQDEFNSDFVNPGIKHVFEQLIHNIGIFNSYDVLQSLAAMRKSLGDKVDASAKYGVLREQVDGVSETFITMVFERDVRWGYYHSLKMYCEGEALARLESKTYRERLGRKELNHRYFDGEVAGREFKLWYQVNAAERQIEKLTVAGVKEECIAAAPDGVGAKIYEKELNRLREKLLQARQHIESKEEDTQVVQNTFQDTTEDAHKSANKIYWVVTDTKSLVNLVSIYGLSFDVEIKVFENNSTKIFNDSVLEGKAPIFPQVFLKRSVSVVYNSNPKPIFGEFCEKIDNEIKSINFVDDLAMRELALKTLYFFATLCPYHSGNKSIAEVFVRGLLQKSNIPNQSFPVNWDIMALCSSSLEDFIGKINPDMSDKTVKPISFAGMGYARNTGSVVSGLFPAAKFKQGDQVEINGLQSTVGKKLNGTLCDFIGLCENPDKNGVLRCVVRIFDQERKQLVSMRIKPDNLNQVGVTPCGKKLAAGNR